MDMYYTTELDYQGKAYQLTFDEDSTESPGWMEVKSYIVPTVNQAGQLNRWFLDGHVNEVLTNWGKDHLGIFGPALRMMGATDADFLRFGLELPAEVVVPKKTTAKRKQQMKKT
jgi:prepilin-type processing-associated H-X9-DG protein